MPGSATIIECPRDAWQGLPQNIRTQEKIKYLSTLVSLGFSHKKDVGMGLVSSHWTIEKAALVRSFSESMIR